MDYRLLSVIALLLWGSWGFLTKVVAGQVSSQNLAFWSTLATILPVAVFVFTDNTGKLLRPHPLVILSGFLSGMAYIFFLLALRRGPASVVVPLSGMYILIPAVLGVIFLSEKLSIMHILGLVCAGLAVFFLSR
ncbi:MAG: DMT family transporter [candidate division WOR-3 bacterium]